MLRFPNRPDRAGLVDETVADPVELLAIQADDEVLDELGGASLDPALDPAWARELAGGSSGYGDDLRVLALLRAWRYDVESEPWPELVSTDRACALITEAAGVARRPGRRRAVSLAAAAAVGVFAMSGMGIVAGQARPGDPLWGLSRWLDGDRATSMEAEQRVSVALASARRALADGHPGEARAVLAGVGRDLEQVRDTGARRELARTTENLVTTALTTPEGRQVDTDEHGAPRDHAGQGTEPAKRPTDQRSTEPAQRPGGEQAGRRPGEGSRPASSGGARPDQPGSAARHGQRPGAGDDPDRRTEPSRPAPEAATDRPSSPSQRPEAPSQRPDPPSERPDPQSQRPAPTTGPTTAPSTVPRQTPRPSATPNPGPGPAAGPEPTSGDRIPASRGR